MATIKGIKVGTTTITASYTDGGVTKTAQVTNFQVTAIAPTLTFTAASGTLTYTGSAQTIGTVAYNGDGTAYYCIVTTTSTTQPSAPTSGWVRMTGSSVSISATNAGYHHVFLKSDAGTNYTAVSTKYTTYKQIGKPTVNVTTAPTFVSSTLTYNGTNNTNGTAQTLIQTTGSTAPACSPSAGGTFYYYVSTSSTAPTSFNASTWSTSAPTGTNAGNYYVWYYCYVSDTNNYAAGTNANTIKALDNNPKNIGRKKTATASAVTGLVYNGTTETNGTSQTGVTGSTVTWSGTQSATDAGSYSATATPQSNFAWSDGTYAAKTINWSIARRGQTAPVLNGATTTYNITASASVKTNGTVEGGTAVAPGSLVWTNQTRSVEGTQQASAHYAATTTNFSASPESEEVAVTVNPATITVVTTGKTSVINQSYSYTGSAQGVGLTATTVGNQTATIKYGTTSGTYNLSSAPQATSVADSKTVYYQVTAPNHTTVTGSYTLTITKRAIPITAPTVVTDDLIYDKTAQTVANPGSCGTGGTMYYYVSTSSTTPTFSTSTWSTSVPKQTNAGTYNIWYYCQADAANNSGNINTVTKISSTKTISQKEVSLVWNPSPATWTYDGSQKTVTCTASGVISGDTCTVTVSNNTRTNAGSQTVTATGLSNSNYKLPSSPTTTLTINKADLTVTAVSYSGEWDGSNHSSTVRVENDDWTGKTIVKGSSTSYGTTVTTTGAPDTVYALQTASAYTAKTTIYYKITGDTNYNDYTGSVTFEIKKKKATLPTTISGDRVDTDHTPARATVSKDYTGGTLQYSTDNGSTWSTVTWSSGNLTANPSTSTIGEVSVKFRVNPDSNHSVSDISDAITLTVIKSTDSSVTITPASGTLTYNTNPQTIATASNAHGITSYYIGYKKGSQATADNQITWNSANVTPLQATDAGEYYVYYKFTADSSHEGDQAYTYVGKVTINKASRSGAVSCSPASPITYGTTTQASVSGNLENGTVTWGITNGTGKATVNSSGVVTATQAGTVTVTASVAATANYNAYTATPATITISKADGVVTYSTSNPAAKYCITTANAADAAATDIEFTIATASASSSTNTGVTITYSISESGWSISSDGKKVTVPEDTPAGTYNITVTATAPATTNYNQAQATKSVKIILTAVVLTGVSLTIPVNQIAYNAETTATLVATYNNGETKDVTAHTDTTYSSSPTGIVTITK